MNALRTAWKVITSRPVVAAVALLVGLLLTGELADWLRVGRWAPKVVYRAAPGSLTREAAKWRTVRQPVTVDMPDLPPEEIDRIGKKYGRSGLTGGPRKDDRAPRGDDRPAPGSPGSAQQGTTPGPSGGFVGGSIARGARPLGEWRFASDDEECAIDVAAFLELDGSVTTSGLWTNTPADNPRPIVSTTDPKALLGIPLRWRVTVAGIAWPEPDLTAALAFRVLRVHRLELSPAAIAGYDFNRSDFRAGLGGVVTWDW